MQIVSRTGAARLVVQSIGYAGVATVSGGLVMNAQEQPLIRIQIAAAGNARVPVAT